MTNSLDRLLGGAILTLRDEVVPHIGEASVRAAAVSVLQVLDLLALRADWSSVPFASAHAARRRMLAELSHISAAPPIPQQTTDMTCDLLKTLQDGIFEMDQYVVALVRWLDREPGTIAPEARLGIERWIAGYGAAAASVELEYTPRSRTGAMTESGS